MKNKGNEPDYDLGFIVPVTKIIGKELNLKNWMSNLPNGSFEIILVHDIQDTVTSPFLNEIVSKLNNSRVHLHEISANSPGVARNYGLKMCSAKWIQFVDADDLPNIQGSLNLISDNGFCGEIILGNYSVSNNGKIQNYSLTNCKDPFEMLAMNPGLWRIIFPRDLVKDIFFREYKMAEDQLFLLDINFFSQKILIFERNIYTYFKNLDGQLTGSKNSISDISNVIPITVGYLKKSSNNVSKYIAIFLIRQLITEFKNTQIFKRPRLLKNFFLICTRLGPSKTLVALNAMYRVLYFKAFYEKK